MPFLPSYSDFKNQFSLAPYFRAKVLENRQTISNILKGIDPRKLLIVGPCSIHEHASAIEFGSHLKRLSKEVEGQFLLVMRVYCEKGRTSTGWKGYLYDPLLDGSNQLNLGLEKTRKLMLDLVAMDIPIATEFLDPLTAFYYDDLISWGSIGARTSSSQVHRQLASSLEMPIGFKNTISGNIMPAIEGVLASLQSHTYMGLNVAGKPIAMKTQGNPDAHVVLRGGENGPNFNASSVLKTVHCLEKHQLVPSLLIDCSHHNSGKNYKNQSLVFESVIQQIIEGNDHIRGLMLESHLNAGNQPIGNGKNLAYGTSVTDGCLDWAATSTLIHGANQNLQMYSSCGVA